MIPIKLITNVSELAQTVPNLMGYSVFFVSLQSPDNSSGRRNDVTGGVHVENKS